MVSIMYNFWLLQKKLKRQPFSIQPLFRRRIVVACVNVEYMSSEQGNTDQGDNKSEKRALQEASTMEESTT